MELSDTKITQTQNQVDDVIRTMQLNLQEVIQRGDNLEELEHRADHMTNNAQQFQVQATKVQRKFKVKYLKWWIFGTLCLAILVAVIVVLAIFA